MSMALLAVAPLLGVGTARPARRAQAAEPSWNPAWDPLIQTCLEQTFPDPNVTDARVIKLVQESFNSVEVQVTGYDFNPEYVWITNAAGTVIALESNPGAGSRSYTWTQPSAGSGEPPAQLYVNSCPPLYNQTAIDSWRGRYEDAAAYCCAELDSTSDEKQRFGVSLNVNWRLQTVTASAVQQALVLNYVRNEVGTVLGAAGPGWAGGGPTDALTMADFGDAGTTSLRIPPLSQSLVACSINSELTKEICTTVDLVSPSTCSAMGGTCTPGGSGLSQTNDGLIANLQTNNTNPGSFTTPLHNTTTAITGPPPLRELLSARATFSFLGTAQVGRHCVMFARTAINAGDVLGFSATEEYQVNSACQAQGKGPDCLEAQSVDVSLTIDVPSDATAFPDVVVHGCCGVEVDAGSTPPVICNANALKVKTFSVAALREQARNKANLATLSAGFGALSETFGPQCDLSGVAVLPGASYSDYEEGSANFNKNCTCTKAGNGVVCDPPGATACFICEEFPGFDRFLTDAQTALFAIVGLFAGLALVGVLCYVMRKRGNKDAPYRNTMVEIPGGRA